MLMFLCSICLSDYPDYYKRASHTCDQDICFECWCYHWYSVIKPRLIAGRRWQQSDLILLLRIQGYHWQDISKVVGLHESTIWTLRKRMRDNPDMIPLWLEGYIKEQKEKDKQKNYRIRTGRHRYD